MDLDRLNDLPEDEALTVFAECCASEEWARRMAEQRPYPDVESLCRTASEVWWDLDAPDWLQAFSAHPRIGERRQGDDRHSAWSRREQAGADDASAEIRTELERLNREYEERFGRVYLVFASGKSAEEMLRLCRERLANDPEEELRIAAAEQEKITDLRIRRLLGIG